MKNLQSFDQFVNELYGSRYSIGTNVLKFLEDNYTKAYPKSKWDKFVKWYNTPEAEEGEPWPKEFTKDYDDAQAKVLKMLRKEFPRLKTINQSILKRHLNDLLDQYFDPEGGSGFYTREAETKLSEFINKELEE